MFYNASSWSNYFGEIWSAKIGECGQIRPALADEAFKSSRLNLQMAFNLWDNFMHSILCDINGKEYELMYSSKINKSHVEFSGTLYVDPPFDFRYIILNETDTVMLFEPKDLDELICDRITQIILNKEKKINKNR